MKKISFSAGNEQLAGVIYSDGILPNTIFLHGASPTGKEKIAYIAPLFAERGFPMLAFDFSGHGESSGTIANSSLAKKISEAHEALKLLDPEKKITVIGSSMGGHLALEMLKTGRVQNLILFCPAVYSDESVHISFGPEFSQEIRKPNSWIDSSLFTELTKFRGRLIIVIGQEDQVIPKEVIGKLVASATNITHRELIFVPGADHSIHQWLQDHPEDFAHVTEKIFAHLYQD